MAFLTIVYQSGFSFSLKSNSNRDTGVNAIESLMAKKGKFDYILLETTGLADPGNIAPLFWMDDGLGSTIFLDGVVTLVDAKNILRSLDAPEGSDQTSEHNHADEHGPLMTTAHVQISHADVIVINKADLVNDDELARVRERIQSINGLAKIHVTTQSTVPQLEGVLLDLHAYETVEAVERAVNQTYHSHLDPVRNRPSSCEPVSHFPVSCLLYVPRLVLTVLTVNIDPSYRPRRAQAVSGGQGRRVAAVRALGEPAAKPQWRCEARGPQRPSELRDPPHQGPARAL